MDQLSNSLVIATYNWPEALDLVLQSVKIQVRLPDEVIIADDGSDHRTRDMIQDLQRNFPVPLHHVWHEDTGFKKSEILNKAIAQASGKYIIQADGDCILHPHFVSDHLKFAEEKVYLYGSRVNIQEGHLQELFSKRTVRFSPFSLGIKNRTRAMRIPFFSNLYRKRTDFSKKYRGCNTSYFKSDFFAVNGYNENFIGWGREDSELALRFLNFGLSARRLRYMGIVFHIFHKEKEKDRLKFNNELEFVTRDQNLTWSTNGVDKYLNS